MNWETRNFIWLTTLWLTLLWWVWNQTHDISEASLCTCILPFACQALFDEFFLSVKQLYSMKKNKQFHLSHNSSCSYHLLCLLLLILLLICLSPIHSSIDSFIHSALLVEGAVDARPEQALFQRKSSGVCDQCSDGRRQRGRGSLGEGFSLTKVARKGGLDPAPFGPKPGGLSRS